MHATHEILREISVVKNSSCFLEKLNVDVKQIQTGVEGLAYLFIEAGKNNVSKYYYLNLFFFFELILQYF